VGRPNLTRSVSSLRGAKAAVVSSTAPRDAPSGWDGGSLRDALIPREDLSLTRGPPGPWLSPPLTSGVWTICDVAP